MRKNTFFLIINYQTVISLVPECGIANPKASAMSIFALERNIAEAHMTKTLMRDPEKTFNKMPVAVLSEMTSGQFDWNSYFSILKVRDFGANDVNVSTVDALKTTIALMSSTEKSVVREYLIFHAINSVCAHLPRSFVDAHFNFFEKELKGTVEQRPRWKRSLEAIDDSLGEVMGKLYTSKHFDPTCKARALTVVEAVRDALRERLGEIDWMGAESKVEAFRKMEGFKVKIGYPNKWIDYSGLEVKFGQHLENVFAARAFDKELDMSRVNAPTDRYTSKYSPHPTLPKIFKFSKNLID